MQGSYTRVPSLQHQKEGLNVHVLSKSMGYFGCSGYNRYAALVDWIWTPLPASLSEKVALSLPVNLVMAWFLAQFCTALQPCTLHPPLNPEEGDE